MKVFDKHPIEDLDPKLRRLVHLALKVRKRAYAPYSKYLVGVVIVDGRGHIHSGCNVENASYGVSVCAERVAITKMVSRGAKEIRRLVLVTSSDEPVFPCGLCRQSIAEFGPEAMIVTVNRRATVFSQSTLSEILPSQFNRSVLT